jgi:2-polyprenyl-3-methyl-5-hydroxy-6-metoxy-1,4-benzoquinol methylase
MAEGLAVEPVEHCPACGGTGSTPLLRQPDRFVASHWLGLAKCLACDFVYLEGRLTLESNRQLENVNTVYQMTPEVAEEKIGILTGMVASLEGHAPRRGRLLDIGCNRGLLMEAARRRGWQAVGVELSPVAAQRAREDYGHEVHPTLDDVEALDRFDLAVAWHVLEHTADPVAFLGQVARLLRPDGVLAIQVPSFDYLDEFRSRSMITHLVCAVHNLYFTEATLAAVLVRSGLVPISGGNSPGDLTLTMICARPHAALTASRRTEQDLRSRIHHLDGMIRDRDSQIRDLSDQLAVRPPDPSPAVPSLRRWGPMGLVRRLRLDRAERK